MDSTEKKQTERHRIFVVGGSPEIFDLVRELLQEEQYNITTTNFAPETFDEIEALAPSLLIIELAVDVTVEWDLLECLVRTGSTRAIPVIIMSTIQRDLTEIRDDLARFGGQRLLLAPFEIDELLAMVVDLIGSA